METRDGGWVTTEDYDAINDSYQRLVAENAEAQRLYVEVYTRILVLEPALLEGIKAVNGLLAKNKGLTAYKVAGDWRESVKTLVVNYGTAEHPCSVPTPQQDTP